MNKGFSIINFKKLFRIFALNNPKEFKDSIESKNDFSVACKLGYNKIVKIII